MWNYVQMDDGEWYDIDCTWDDKVTIIKIAKLIMMTQKLLKA